MQKFMLLMSALLIATVMGQDSGHGISKFTKGHSHPHQCLEFFENILGGQIPPSSCPNSKCECATQGRAQICKTDQGASFGMHSINCTYHPYGEHSIYDIERKDTAEVGNFSTYNQHMDSNAGLQTSDLSHYINKIGNSTTKYPHLRQKYESNGHTVYSITVQPCGGYFIDIFSTQVSEHDTSDFILNTEPHFEIEDVALRTLEGDEIFKVSRATTKISELVEFYTKTIGGKLVSRKNTTWGEFAIVKLEHADTQLHFVMRPPKEGAKFTVADLETYVNSVHDKYIKSTNCGFDQFADHHWGYDVHNHEMTLSSMARKLEEGGYKYRWFANPSGNYQIYAFDPSGWTFQLDMLTGNDVPSKVAKYQADCKSDDGCYGQGLCDDDLWEGAFFYNTKGWEFFLQ